MYVEVNLFGASVLILIFAVLLVISQTRKPSPANARRAVKQERRAHPRYQTSLRIKYRTPLDEGISWIKDISQSGARLFLNSALQSLGIGEPLELEISLPSESQPICVKGNIVWSKDSDAGLRFAEAMSDDIDRIIQHVNAGDQNTK
jgi:hypothetical protein